MSQKVIKGRSTVLKLSSSVWTSKNPILKSGEWGYETDTGLIKMGDGLTNWSSLPYLPSQEDVASITEERIAEICGI